MTDLADLQSRFFSMLIDPACNADVRGSLVGGPAQPTDAWLSVYQRSFVVRLQRCLMEQFPAVCHALGEGLFVEFCREYLRDHLPSSHSLCDLGDHFVAWLEANRPDRSAPAAEREAWIDFVVDLADYEHTLFKLFDAAGSEDTPLATGASRDEQLILQPALRLITARFPVAAYYHDVKAGRAPELPPSAAAFFVIVRRDYQTTTYPVTRLHHDFLSAVERLHSVPDALKVIAARHQRPLNEVARSWRERTRAAWLTAGFFVDRECAGEANREIERVENT